MEVELLSMMKTYLGDGYCEEDDGKILVLIQNNIDDFKNNMCYPASFTDEKISEDLSRNKSCLFKCVLYDYNMQGMEYQNSHSESGVSRSFAEKAKIYADCGVVPYAET